MITEFFRPGIGHVETIYWAAFALVALLFLVFCAYRCFVSCLSKPLHYLGSVSIYHLFLYYLVYPRVFRRLPGLTALSPVQVILLLIYVTSTIVCNFVGAYTAHQRAMRAAHLSLINLCPLFLSGGHEFGARILGMSRQTYGLIHRMAGLMASIQAAIHIGLVCQEITFTIHDSTQYYGFVAGCILLSLLLVPLVKRRVYEVFLIVHLACAFLVLYMIWKHVPPAAKTAQRYILACLATFSATVLLRLLRILFRNFVFGRKSVRMSVTPHVEEEVVCAELVLPRPWKVRAGERVTLGVPAAGLFYLYQAHPFSISWWEENENGEAERLHLLFRARAGFTRKVFNCLDADREYWAWIDGPFGPPAVHQGGIMRDLGDYGHILMATTGIGIAAQLPYMKELVQRRREAGVRTRRICLVWQLDRTGDYECARDWIQELLAQDDGYLLKVCVYDPSRGIVESEKIGQNGLLTIYGGEVDWAQTLAEEMEGRKGRILVSVSAQRRVRTEVQRLVRMNVKHDVELFELEFQPWQERRDWLSFFTP